MWFLLVLLLVAGFGITYSISPAARARRKADAAVNRLQALLRSVDDAHRQAMDQETKTAQVYAGEVRHLRLKAINVEELKRHASGLRLSALRNAGIDDFSQMQGWSAQRLMQVRGIGPDSAQLPDIHGTSVDGGSVNHDGNFDACLFLAPRLQISESAFKRKPA